MVFRMRIEETVINIIFDAAKGETPVRSREGILGERMGELPVPTRAGYTFAGWYLGEEAVTGETVIASESDLRLVARWEKKKGERRRTMLRRQKIVAAVLAAVIVALSVALAIANDLVGVYTLKDTYTDEAGVERTLKYTVKRDKSDGLYALYNKKGEKMAVVPDNGFNNYTSTTDGVQYLVYETDVSGNQYRINTATGAFETYAVVDTEGDEILGGTVVSTRVMMYPRIRQAETYAVEVSNEKGTYKIYRKTVENTAADAKTPYTSAVTVATWNGTDWVDASAAYDPTLYASLCVSCGYSLTMQKLDLNDPAAPRTASGEINYASYGLEVVTDDHGEVDYSKSPAKFTITKGETAADGSFAPTDTAYTVYVGDAIVSGGGYYVKRADREAVYIVAADVADTVLQPVEKLVTPMVVYPMGVATYTMVEQFALARVDTTEPGATSHLSLITEFDYWDLTDRENTLYSGSPYVIPTGSEAALLQGYEIDSNSVTTVLYNLYGMKFLACKKLDPTLEDLRAHHLVDDVVFLTFRFNTTVQSGGSGPYVQNNLLISQKQYDDALGQNVYYIYSQLYNMIVAVDPYYAAFVEWETSHWYNGSYFQSNIAYLREIHYTLGEKQYDFYLDNSATDQSKGPASDKVVITCPQYEGEGHVLDYSIHVDEPTDTGTVKPKDYTALDNFRRFYSRLLYCSIEGDVNAAEFKASTGMTVDEWIAADTADDKCVAKIAYSIEDYAVVANTAKDADGNKLWTENNRRDVVFRYYEYGSGRKYLLTVEILSYDANGDPLPSDATQAHGMFYINSASLGAIAGYAEDLLQKTLIPSMY